MPDHVTEAFFILSCIPVGPPLAVHPTENRVDLGERRVPSSTKILQREYITLPPVRPPTNAWQQLASRVYIYTAAYMYTSQHITMAMHTNH